MQQCWLADANSRPTFPDICHRLERRLRDITAEKYGYLEAASDYYVGTEGQWRK